MEDSRILLDNTQLNLTVKRLCYELIENHNDFESSVIVGLQPRGSLLAEQIHSRLTDLLPGKNIHLGVLDITFYRDDFRRRDNLITASTTEMDFLIEGKKVILIDDVLYTGRTIRSGLDALMDFGRADSVEVLALVDRRLSRELPIEANYIGKIVDVVEDERVDVIWEENNSRVLLNKKNNG